MNILFVTIAWPKAGGKNLYSYLINELAARGHKVYVAGTRTGANSTAGKERSNEGGVEVLRVHTPQVRKVSYVRKFFALHMLRHALGRGIRKHYSDIDFDLILVNTPPITLSRLIKSLKARYNSHVYLLLRDIWPQGSVDYNVFKKYGPLWWYFRNHEKRIYQISDTIGCMSSAAVKYVLDHNRYLDSERVEVCPNSMTPTQFETFPEPGDIRQRYGIPEDACVFLFSGNLEMGNGLAFLVQAIKALQDYSHVFFIIGGSGTHFNYIRNQLEGLSHQNFFLYKWLPQEDFDRVLATSDVGLILLSSQYTYPQFPSRLLSYLDTSMPVLCAVDRATDIGAIVERSNCGRSVYHGELEDFIDAIKWFAEHPEERSSMGRNARSLLLEQYTSSLACKIIEDRVGLLTIIAEPAQTKNRMMD
jgi:glycosyltransferase involved in cell wall biosynthesis